MTLNVYLDREKKSKTRGSERQTSRVEADSELTMVGQSAGTVGFGEQHGVVTVGRRLRTRRGPFRNIVRRA